MKKTFNSAGDFSAFYEASDYLKIRGFSVGGMQRGDPIGILFGDFEIAKWRNLDTQERSELHGVINGDKRNGPITVEIFDSAPNAAKIAFKNAGD